MDVRDNNAWGESLTLHSLEVQLRHQVIDHSIALSPAQSGDVVTELGRELDLLGGRAAKLQSPRIPC